MHLKDGMLDRSRLQPLLYFLKGLWLDRGPSARAGYRHPFALGNPHLWFARLFFLLWPVVFIIIQHVVLLMCLKTRLGSLSMDTHMDTHMDMHTVTHVDDLMETHLMPSHGISIYKMALHMHGGHP